MKKTREKLRSYRRFTTPSDVFEWVGTHYSQDELDQFDVKKNPGHPLTWYKGGLYKDINTVIRRGWIDSYSTVDIDAIQEQLLQMHIAENITVTRFTSFKEYGYLYWHTMFRKTLEYPGFLSTTMLKDNYAMDEIRRWRIPISIYIPAGAPGMYLPEVNPSSPEYEILLPYHTKIQRITSDKYIVSV